MSTIIESIEQRQLRRIPRFAPGDRVRVHFQVVEGSRRRTQVFEGVVIARRGGGARETFTVRKQSFGVGVERTFPVHSPKIERLEVVARGEVRRAKLYYLRGRVGKRARVAERRWGIEDDLVITAPEGEAVDSEGVVQSEAESIGGAEGGEDGEEAEGEQAAEPEEAVEPGLVEEGAMPADDAPRPGEEELAEQTGAEEPEAEGAGGEPAAEADQAPAEPEPVADSEAKGDEPAQEPAEQPGDDQAS